MKRKVVILIGFLFVCGLFAGEKLTFAELDIIKPPPIAVYGLQHRLEVPYVRKYILKTAGIF